MTYNEKNYENNDTSDSDEDEKNAISMYRLANIMTKTLYANFDGSLSYRESEISINALDFDDAELTKRALLSEESRMSDD